MGIWAKSVGFGRLIINDASMRAINIARAFLANQNTQLSRQDLYFLNQPLPPDVPRWIEAQYSPSVFSHRHAQKLDQWLYWASQIQDPVRGALYLMVIWHCINAFRCYPTSRGTSNGPYAEALDGLRRWDSINPKRFRDGSVERLLKPTLDVLERKLNLVNQGVFSGSPVEIHHGDAIEILPKLNGDMVYLDPPYAGTQRYDEGFALVDELLFSENTFPATDFSSSVDALHALLESVQHIPTWILSYGNQQIDLDGLEAVVQKHAKNRKVKGYSKCYSHMRHLTERRNNQELLIIASMEN